MGKRRLKIISNKTSFYIMHIFSDNSSSALFVHWRNLLAAYIDIFLRSLARFNKRRKNNKFLFAVLKNNFSPILMFSFMRFQRGFARVVERFGPQNGKNNQN